MDNIKNYKASNEDRFRNDSGFFQSLNCHIIRLKFCENLILRLKRILRKIKTSGGIVTFQKINDIINNFKSKSFVA